MFFCIFFKKYKKPKSEAQGRAGGGGQGQRRFFGIEAVFVLNWAFVGLVLLAFFLGRCNAPPPARTLPTNFCLRRFELWGFERNLFEN
jgi:hypothetical protein